MEDHIVFTGLKDSQLESLFGAEFKVKINSINQINGPSDGLKSKIFYDLFYLENKKRLLNCLSSQQKLFLQNDSENLVESINPVIPVWLIERNNPIRDSRTNLIDLIGVNNSIQNLFYHQGIFLCPSCKKPYSEHNEILVFIDENKISQDDVITISTEEFISENEERQPENIVSRRLKIKNIHKIDDVLSEVFAISERAFLQLNEKTLTIPKNYEKQLRCEACGDEFDNSDFNKTFLSNLNSYGACGKCKGYGATLEYDGDALIESYTATIRDGIKIFKRPTYAKYLKKFELDLKSHKLSLDDRIDKNIAALKKTLMQGGKNFRGFKILFEELEEKKYQPAVRIFLRSVQSEVKCLECLGTKINIEISKRLHLKIGEYISYHDFLKLSPIQARKVLNKVEGELVKDAKDALSLLNCLGLGSNEIYARARDFLDGDFQRSFVIKHYLLGLTDTILLLDNILYGLAENVREKLCFLLQEINARGNTLIFLEENEVPLKDVHFIVTKVIENNIDESYELPKNLIKSLNQNLCTNKVNFIPPSEQTFFLDFKIKVLNPIYFKLFNKRLFDYPIHEEIVMDHAFESIEFIDSRFSIRTSRSTIGTVTGVLNYFRTYWPQLEQSLDRKFSSADFSSNTASGMCQDCSGKGFKETDLLYFGVIQEKCNSCKGLKHKTEVLGIIDEATGFSFADIIQLRIDDLITFYPGCIAGNSQLAEYLNLLGLDHLKMCDELNKLSRGELSRFKLALAVHQSRFKSLFVLENISLELNFEEVQKIKEFIQRYVLDSHFLLICDPHFS